MEKIIVLKSDVVQTSNQKTTFELNGVHCTVFNDEIIVVDRAYFSTEEETFDELIGGTRPAKVVLRRRRVCF